MIGFLIMLGALAYSLEGHCTPGLLRSPHGRTLTEGALRAQAPKTTNGHAPKGIRLDSPRA